MTRDEVANEIEDRYGIFPERVWPMQVSRASHQTLIIDLNPYDDDSTVVRTQGTTWREAFDSMRWDLRGRAELARVVCEFLRWLVRAPIVVASGNRCQACHSADPARPNVPWCMACRATLDARSCDSTCRYDEHSMSCPNGSNS